MPKFLVGGLATGFVPRGAGLARGTRSEEHLFFWVLRASVIVHYNSSDTVCEMGERSW